MSRFVKELEEVTPNLIPIMNLFTALIPFLLMSAAFFQLTIIQISVPISAQDGETDVAKEDDKITLNMRITDSEFRLSASSESLTPDVLAKLKTTVSRPQGDGAAHEATLQELKDAAFQIKGDYTKSDTVVIVPDDEVPYELIIDAIDSVRETAIERDGIRSQIKLFPKVVLSSIVK